MKQLAKKFTQGAIILSVLGLFSGCGGAQDPLITLPNQTPPPPSGSIRTPNPIDLTPAEQAATGPCVPSVPTTGQSIVVATEGRDPQADDPTTQTAIYPNGDASISYVFDTGAFTMTSSNPAAYTPEAGGTYDEGSGLITANDSANLADPMVDSAISFSPSDWPQQIARKLATTAPGSPTPATLQIAMSARGYLPNMLAVLGGGSSDPQKETLKATFTVTAWRDADSVRSINGSSVTVCNFHFEIERPFQVDKSLILVPGDHGPYNLGGPEGLSPASEIAAAAALGASGPTLDTLVVANGLGGLLFLEPYMPAFKGTMVTSDQVPFVPVEVSWEHTYGISSSSFPSYNNSTGTNQRDVRPAVGGPATQKFTFVSTTP